MLRESLPVGALFTDPWPVYLLKLGSVVLLVLSGAVFAGLTLGLMGLDLTHLQVIKESGTLNERRNATKVLRLLGRGGKHWVLVTLLLSNVVVNATLPIVLDSVIGGGWQAILISTALIVVFGEIIPQAICVRYGLAIGAKCSTWVLMLMYLTSPVGYPISLLLDYFLGKHQGTIYKKAGLKTLVSLHQSGDATTDDLLTEDEVLIIGSVLDLRGKPVSKVMTPIQDVFTLSMDSVLDKETVTKILSQGYSRIPVCAADDPMNFVNMLLVKQLIAYDSDTSLPVKCFDLTPLPTTGNDGARPDTSCLDILNFFQEGKSHLALISNSQGGALGVITLEDVIEELIGEEIIDETDIYVDVHKKVKAIRKQPKVWISNIHALLRRVRSTNDIQAEQQNKCVVLPETSVGSAGYGALVSNSPKMIHSQPNATMYHKLSSTPTHSIA
ncbi:hypothetical protein [Absidia glauca]|uniref:CNNM transmembrane domain-containing protein n=1 Tax=Absidia glauca TaxID=4829 RepID=A0A168SKP9_ABSGL|nr:hypothetical protein [Absidia glauca]